MDVEDEKECIMVSKLRIWVNEAAKIKYRIFYRFWGSRRVKDPEHGMRISLR